VPSADSKVAPRVRVVNRKQMVLRAVDVETLIEPEHPARSIWDLVGRLNLDLFYGCIRSLEGGAGRSTFDPHLLICIWIYAYSRGIGSAREIARLCEIDPVFQGLTGLETINHHTLSDFRVDNREALDELFTQVLGLLSHEGLITLERLMQDGTKVRALAAGNSFAKEERIQQHLETARQHVRDMGAPEQEAGADRTQARVRADRDRVNRLERALDEVQKLRAAKME
jgi:transposase